VAIYLKIEGVEGPVTEAGHDKWIELNSFQWGVGRGISGSVGNMANRESSQPSISEVVVTHTMDKASINIFDLSINDAKGKKYEVDFVRTATGAGVPGEIYLHYEFENTMISGYSLSSGGDMPQESISLNFTKMTEKFTDVAANNADAKPVIKGFDLATGKSF
jgi:type VI secretion system secreted protein Hcp